MHSEVEEVNPKWDDDHGEPKSENEHIVSSQSTSMEWCIQVQKKIEHNVRRQTQST